jgi:uncharacterized protein YceH (UPF0502 family)
LCLGSNQKTARYPVTSYSEGEVGHAVRELESMGLVREIWGARVPKYEHNAGKTLNLHRQGLALLCPLMLRGPQTLGELKSHSQRLYTFDDLDDVRFAIERLANHEPPLAIALPKQPGQKEGRYAHLLAGEPDISAMPAVSPATSRRTDRMDQLEAKLESICARLVEIESRLGIESNSDD